LKILNIFLIPISQPLFLFYTLLCIITIALDILETEVINMTVQLTTKETMLMQDQKSQEELCVQKYQSYSQLAQDPELKQLFSSLAKKEQEHLNSINQIISGGVPNVGSQSSSQQFQASSTQSQQGIMGGGEIFSDKDLCSDMLATEKYVSSAYDTAIFECTKPEIRQVLNHIQKEEQQHGEQIFNYMNSHGMYSVQ
jgi:spore coat protein CotF